MKIHFAVLCLLLGACAGAQSADIAIRDATVVDVTGGALVPDQTVVIAGNRIVAVGPADKVSIAPDTEVIEGAGGYIIPGLWDMHVHSVRAADWHFPLFLAHGVTGVRDLNDGTGDVTLALTHSIRRRLADGDLPGPPRFLGPGPSVEGYPPLLGPSNPVVVRTADEARAVVDSLVDAGADFIKPYENLSREAYFAIMDQARRRGIPVDGHVPFRVTAEEAGAAGQRTAEHPEVMAAGCSADAEAVRERFASVFSDIGSLSESEQFLVQFRLYRAFYDTRDPAVCATTIGVPLQVPGISLHVQLERFVEAGLTPLEDISNTQRIRTVIADVRPYRRADLDQLITEVAAVEQAREDQE